MAELEQCIEAYGKEVYAFCRQLTGKQQEAEDLYQDTFLKALELSEKIEFDRNPKSYLISIALRIWKNRRRKYAWRNRIAGMEELNEVSEQKACGIEENPVEEEFLSKETKRLVLETVKEMEEKYRVVVILFYTLNFSVEEIAKLLKIPRGTVKSRLHKAREILRKELEELQYEA